MRVQAVSNKRKFKKFNKFRGVDYSSSPLEVVTNRATDMANLILREGTLHKRNGFEQKYYLGGTEKIKGAWLMNINNEDVVIYLQGQKLFAFNTSKNEQKAIYTSQDEKITDTASAFVSGDTLYILCGEYLHVKYAKTEDEEGWDVFNLLDTKLKRGYIPTTTINIHSTYSTAENRERLSNEPINALTGWRKNYLVWNTDGYSETADFCLFYLDAYCARPLKETAAGTNDYNAPVLYYRKKIWEDFEEIGTFVKENDISWNLVGQIAADFGLDGAGISCGKKGHGDEAFITIPIKKDEYGVPILENGDEIFIEFKAVDGEGNDESLKSLDSVGATFGVDGRADRLFIASNNFVRYTENTLQYLPNYTYLPTTSFVRCGTTGKVTAMMRLADGRLAVFKDSENNQEPSLYYISGVTIEAYSDNTGTVGYDELFTAQAGNIEENCPSPYGISTLAGDSLFVSKTGVYGIELSDNVAANDRFARERSRIINAKLTQFDLANAKAVVYDNRYYLAVGGEKNEVYVADARYRFTADGDMANSFNYEWFRWTDIPVELWLLKDGELWFISKDKYLCRFTDKYYDKYLTENGETVHDDEEVEDGKVYFDKALLPIVQRALYAEYGDELWNVGKITNYGDEASPKYAFDAPDGEANGIVNLAFVCPVKAYWKSAVTDLGSSVHRKNMYSLSVVAAPAKQSVVEIGYTTRLRDRMAMTAEGTNAFDFTDLTLESYGEEETLYQMFSFDAGGFISAYRQRVFERNFVYAQFVFACNSIGDCIVEEIAVEYIPTIKNIGVG